MITEAKSHTKEQVIYLLLNLEGSKVLGELCVRKSHYFLKMILNKESITQYRVLPCTLHNRTHMHLIIW